MGDIKHRLTPVCHEPHKEGQGDDAVTTALYHHNAGYNDEADLCYKTQHSCGNEGLQILGMGLVYLRDALCSHKVLQGFGSDAKNHVLSREILYQTKASLVYQHSLGSPLIVQEEESVESRSGSQISVQEEAE